MSKFHYHESLKSRIKVLYRQCKNILYYKKIRFLNRKDVNKAERISFHLEKIKHSYKKPEYDTVFNNIISPKIAVYTCIFGDYDSIKKINCKSKLCDYWIITDRDVDQKNGWKLFKFDFPKELQNAPANIKNRYCKMHPHILFPEYDFSIYLDGSMQIDADIFPLLGRLGSHFIGMYDHYNRDCIYKEAETVIIAKKAPEDIVNLQMQKYRQDGFPEHFGLTEGAIIVRKHNDPLCIKIMEEWWDVFLKYSKRDQLGLMYVMWTNGLNRDDIATLGYWYEHEPRISSEGHRKGH